MRLCSFFTVGTFLLLLLAGCSSSQPSPSTATRELRVAAAANLKFAFEELTAEFQIQHPEIQVKTTYGSSGNFFAQLTNKAPFDLFLSADVEYPTQLVTQGYVTKEDYFLYAVGKLVVWVPKDSPLDLEKLGLRALLDPQVKRVALANPRHAPYGRAAEAALHKQGIYAEVQPKLVFGDNLDQAAHFAYSGATQAGILSLSLARGPTMHQQGRYWLVPAELHPPLAQAGVILSWAKEKEAARQLRDFLRSETGRTMLQRQGYDLPKE
jgi:molybdate transport system substrate-binding protein